MSSSSMSCDPAQPMFKFVIAEANLECGYTDTGYKAQRESSPAHRVPAKEHTRPCRVCGQLFRPVRFDAQVCSGTCRTRKSRGANLAYLTTLPPDQARARRMLHDAVDSEIAIAKMVGASQREGRATRRNLLKVKRMKAAHFTPSRSS
jgi:hypothetical protein